MLYEELEAVVKEFSSKGAKKGYILNSLKEYLQNIVLDFIYNNKKYNSELVFTGGTCLRFCHGLPRLSEDIDFDCVGMIDKEGLASDIAAYFKRTLLFEQIRHSVKGGNDTIYLKFPILDRLGLTFGNSDVLYVKLDVCVFPQDNISSEVNTISKFGRYYFLKSYSLPDLMSGKIHAFLTRIFFKGKGNESDFKGRDLFDMVWFMGKKIEPNLKRIDLMMKGTKYENMPWKELLKEINKKASSLKKEYVLSDLANFIEHPRELESFMGNYIAV
ncbi:MAG: nucleotidyl transferase AbiEii/AbiGii toxin family protein, partial [Candidatus Margulisiibacteriota bacterium]